MSTPATRMVDPISSAPASPIINCLLVVVVVGCGGGDGGGGLGADGVDDAVSPPIASAAANWLPCPR